MVIVCNIAVDPRVCRGSVFAARRQTTKTRQTRRVEEDRKVDVNLPSKIPCSLPPVIVATSVNRKTKTTVFTQKLQSWSESDLFPRINDSNGNGIDKTKNGKTLFPLRNNKCNGTSTPLVPSLNHSLQYRKEQRRIVSRQGQTTRTRTIEHRLPLKLPPTPPTITPPNSIVSVSQSIQTDMEPNFDHNISFIVCELATGAIGKAVRDLEVEREINELKKQIGESTILIKRERRERREIEEKTKRELEMKNRQLEERVEKERRVETSRQMATHTCREVTEMALKNIEVLEKMEMKRKSVGSDTRQLNRTVHRLDLMTTELEKDFFPWLFAKAEHLYQKKLASDYYESGYPSESLLLARDKSKRKLKISLHKVNF